MIQLNPQENFPITRELDNPFDTATYYVQAKVYELKNRNLLDTVNLTDYGNQTFWAAWQVPADTSGMGRHIYIVTNVYTDSAYTQLSPTYATTNEKYLIQDRVTRSLLGGGGSFGVSPFAKIDYDKMYKELESNLATLIERIIDNKISPIERLISDIKIPKIPPMPDFPEIPEVNYGKIAKMISENHPELKKTLERAVKDEVTALLGGHAEKVKKLMGEMTDHAEKVTEMTQNSTKHFADLAHLKTYLSNLGNVMQSSTDDILDSVKEHITKETAVQTKTIKDHVAKHHAFTNKNIDSK